MIKTLEELRNSESLDNLYKYYDEIFGKNIEEIKTIFDGHGIEVSEQCAKECFDFCKGVEAIKDEELVDVAGGYDINPSIPQDVVNCLKPVIKLLDDEKRYNDLLILEVARKCSQKLKDLLSKPFEIVQFKKTLSDIVVFDIGIFVFSNTSLKFVSDRIQEAQRRLK